jgi:DNA-directed RNA polymerase specialized sigma24 family protein
MGGDEPAAPNRTTSCSTHEWYLQLADAPALGPGGEGQFLVYAERRGGDDLHVTLNTEVAESVALPDADVLRIHEALEELQNMDERLARIVEMRCFAGLDEATIAKALGVTDRTVRRD